MNTKRWLDQRSGAGELERELLRAGLKADPPASAENAVLDRLRSTLGADWSGDAGGMPVENVAGAATSTGGTVAAAKATTGLALFAKGLAVGVGVTLVAVGSNRLMQRSAERTPALQAPVALSPSVNAEPSAPSAGALPAAREGALDVQREAEAPNPVAGSPRARPPASVSPAFVPAETAPFAAAESSAATPLASRSRLREEASMLRRARDELRTGALASALATLEASRRQFSTPELAQEREALTIELLYLSGEKGAARERARAFSERFPDSPHAARVRGFGADQP